MMVQMENIRRTFGEVQAEVVALDGVDLSIDYGEFVAVVGASGSGKSTLLQILGCLDRADEGTFILDGRDVQSLSGREMA